MLSCQQFVTIVRVFYAGTIPCGSSRVFYSGKPQLPVFTCLSLQFWGQWFALWPHVSHGSEEFLLFQFVQLFICCWDGLETQASTCWTRSWNFTLRVFNLLFLQQSYEGGSYYCFIDKETKAFDKLFAQTSPAKVVNPGFELRDSEPWVCTSSHCATGARALEFKGLILLSSSALCGGVTSDRFLNAI